MLIYKLSSNEIISSQKDERLQKKIIHEFSFNFHTRFVLLSAPSRIVRLHSRKKNTTPVKKYAYRGNLIWNSRCSSIPRSHPILINLIFHSRGAGVSSPRHPSFERNFVRCKPARGKRLAGGESRNVKIAGKLDRHDLRFARRELPPGFDPFDVKIITFRSL